MISEDDMIVHTLSQCDNHKLITQNAVGASECNNLLLILQGKGNSNRLKYVPNNKADEVICIKPLLICNFATF